MRAVFFCLLLPFLISTKKVRGFAERFYRARVESNSIFVIDAVSDSLNTEYPLIENGTFKYTGFTIKDVEKLDSSLYKVSASIYEGFKEWKRIGVINEVSLLRYLNGKFRVISIRQSYNNTAIPRADIKDSDDVCLLKNTGLVILEKVEAYGSVRLNVNMVSPDSIQARDSCPSPEFIPDFFAPEKKEVEKKIITLKYNSHRFCFIRGGTEGAAGHLYHYLYFIPIDIKNIVFSFIIETTNCYNYEENQRDVCRKINAERMEYPAKLLQVLRKIK